MEVGGYGRGGGAAAIGSASAVSGWPASAIEGALAFPYCGRQVAFAGASLARPWRHAVSSLPSSTLLRPACTFHRTITCMKITVIRSELGGLRFRVLMAGRLLCAQWTY